MENWAVDLINKIPQEQDRVLFTEALGCHLSGYNRASYIITWISIVESLKNKINEYAYLEHTIAKIAVIEIEKAEKEKKSVDIKIIEEAKKCEIIDDNEYQIVDFLWKQRCIFAHPYQKQPSNEETKHILYKAVEIVLSRELLYSKHLLQELIVNITEKPYFLPNDLKSVKEVAIQNIQRIPERLHAFFFKSLLYKVGEYADDPSKSLVLNKLRVYLVNLLSVSKNDLNGNEFNLEYRAINFPYVSIIGYVHSNTWSKISDRVKTILFNYLEMVDELNKKNILKMIISSLISSDVLEDNYKTKYIELLNGEDFLSAISYYGNVESAYSRIRTDLLAGNFSQQNFVIDFLNSQNGLEVISKINNDSKKDLGRLIYYTAIEGHWKSQSLIDYVIANYSLYSAYIKQGICIGIFIDRYDRLSVDYNLLTKIPKMIDSIDEKLIYELFEMINTAIDWDIRQGKKTYISQEKLVLLKDIILESKVSLSAMVRMKFHEFFTKIEFILGEEGDLPF